MQMLNTGHQNVNFAGRARRKVQRHHVDPSGTKPEHALACAQEPSAPHRDRLDEQQVLTDRHGALVRRPHRPLAEHKGSPNQARSHRRGGSEDR